MVDNTNTANHHNNNMNQSSGKRQSLEHRNYKESMRVWKNMNLELLLKKDLTTECLDLIAYSANRGEMAGRLIPFRWWGW